MNEIQIPWLGIDQWHKAGYSGKGIKVCIVDADADTSLVRYPQRIVNYLGSGKSSDWTKQHGYHGMASIDVFQQFAPQVEIHFASWEYPLENIINYCIRQKIDIVSVSLRYSGRVVSAATSEKAVNAGTLLFTSAGNKGDVPTDLRGYPARKASWVAVGAGLIQLNGNPPNRASYSSTGKELEVMGPTNLRVQMPPPFNWITYTGTSCACPALASMFALIKEKEKTLNKETVRQMFTEHCVDMDEPGRDRRTGWGMFRMPNVKTGRRMKEIVLVIDRPTAKIDGVVQVIDQPAIIMPATGRAVVPLSFIGRQLGHVVQWDQAKRQVIIDGGKIVLTIDSPVAMVNGKPLTTDQPAIINAATSRTLVPLSFIARCLDYTITWAENTRTITIR